jgi:hypothetical protein
MLVTGLKRFPQQLVLSVGVIFGWALVVCVWPDVLKRPEILAVSEFAAFLFIIGVAKRYRPFKRYDDPLEAVLKRRTGSFKLTGRAKFVEGVDTLPVAIALDDRFFYYENPDMQASIAIDSIDEIEYADELSFGKTVTSGGVMRLRMHGQTFEFIVSRQDGAKWKTCLLPKHLSDVPAAGLVRAKAG